MKCTSALRVLCPAKLPEGRINIHPNEGADLGMMTTSYSVDYDGGQLQVFLLNECGKECVELPPKLFEKLGRPRSLVLEFDGASLRLSRT